MAELLSVHNLTVQYQQDGQFTSAVADVSFLMGAGEVIGLVGESGCGKSTLALSIMGLLPERESRVPSGKIIFKGQDILAMTKEQKRLIRGKNIGMIFQDPFSALNPVMTINEQIQEIFAMETGKSDEARAIQLLEEVQLPDAKRILSSYPHQLSGGQRQRIVIACAIARKPDLLIADEPTTALDVLVQDEIIKLLMKLQKEKGMAMIFVTHNLGLVKNVADRVAVMYGGKIVELGKTEQVLKHPQHSYSQALLKCALELTPRSGPLPTIES